MSPGSAGLHISTVRERSTVVASWARSPLSLLTPRARGESVWAYTSSYGGGMVAGDETCLTVALDEGARCFLSTQASTKIYRNPSGRACSHHLEAHLAAASLLILAPDPVQSFADSRYEQSQTIRLADKANLVLIDWLSSGRSACGERWAFRSYSSKNVVHRNLQLVLIDSLRLDDLSGPIKNRFRTGRFNCLATVIILGPMLEIHSARILAELSSRPVTRHSSLIIAASPLREGAILRLAGQTVEEVGRAMHKLLGFIPTLLDGDPWTRKW